MIELNTSGLSTKLSEIESLAEIKLPLEESVVEKNERHKKIMNMKSINLDLNVKSLFVQLFISKGNHTTNIKNGTVNKSLLIRICVDSSRTRVYIICKNEEYLTDFGYINPNYSRSTQKLSARNISNKPTNNRRYSR